MKIRPKNTTGVKFYNQTGADWRSLIFDNYRNHIIEHLSADNDDYGYWLNEMLSRHANIYSLANQSGDWQKTAYLNELVGLYQHDYKGDLRFGTYSPEEDYKIDFNKLGIAKAQAQNRYDVSGPKRTSGDYGNNNYKVDNLYSAITDDRRLLGRKGDWDENSDEFKQWLKDLNSKGWETYLDTDDYYKLRRLSKNDPPASITKDESTATQNPTGNITVPSNTGGVAVQHKERYGFDWNKINKGFSEMIPNLIETGRLVGSLYNNERVFDAELKGIRPNLKQSYLTHRQVVGDEATKQAYYTRAAQGLTKANRSFTSDADRLMAYMMEAKRVGDELKAQGDLADNAEIRRTSDESNEHQYANAKRRAEVANLNIEQINYANAAKLNLLALKYSANWSSWDNFLKTKENRIRQKRAEDEAIQKSIWALEDLYNISNDETLLSLKKAADDAWSNNTPDKLEKIKAYKNYYLQLQKRMLENQRNRTTSGIWSVGKGMKITYKKKDDLLYKSTRDVVEHFRKMSKMSDDSIQRSRPKQYFKLESHPTRKSKKLLQGGVAPFTIFTPVALGGETSTQLSSKTSSDSKSSDSGKETLDLIKSLFQKVDGLPVDVNNVYNSMYNFLAKSQAFGTELTTSDIASMYLLSMQSINGVKYSKEVYDKAKLVATQNDALSEFAVTSNGGYVVQDLNTGKLSIASLEDILKKNLNPITNLLLLYMRAYSPELSFANGDNFMENIINNGIGMTKIAETINKLKGTLGNSETTIEGYTKHASGLIKKGLELLTEAPTGDYKYTQYSKDQLQLIQYALNYILSMLPNNMKAVLRINALNQGITPTDMIKSLLNANSSTSYKLEFDAVTGKASKDGKTTEGASGVKLDASTALINGKGYRDVMEFNTGTSYAVSVNGIHTEFLKHNGENMGLITMNEALLSTLKGVIDFDKATLGGSRLNPIAYNHILINNGDVIAVDLPVGYDKNTPDFTMLKKLQTLDLELLKRGIEDVSENWQQVNQVCQAIGLQPKYNNDGKLNTQNWNRFAAFQVITDDSAFLDKNVILGDIVKTADKSTRDLYELFLQSKSETKDFDLNDGILWNAFGTKQELYQGTVFAPVRSSQVGALISGGLNVSMEQATDLELREQGYDKLKIQTYQKQYNLNDLND